MVLSLTVPLEGCESALSLTVPSITCIPTTKSIASFFGYCGLTVPYGCVNHIATKNLGVVVEFAGHAILLLVHIILEFSMSLTAKMAHAMFYAVEPKWLFCLGASIASGVATRINQRL